MRKQCFLLLVFFIVLIIGCSPKYADLNCKAQSWREYDRSAPINSSETTEERKQKYCEAAVKQLSECYMQVSQPQPPDIKKAEKWAKTLEKYGDKIERKKTKIKSKYCSNTNP